MPEEAIMLAEKLLKSDENYLDNVIALWRIGSQKYGQCWDSEFHIFGEIESETDHLPINHVRSKCSDEFLAKADKELEETIEYYRANVVKACNIIIGSKNL